MGLLSIFRHNRLSLEIFLDQKWSKYFRPKISLGSQMVQDPKQYIKDVSKKSSMEDKEHVE